MAGDGDGPDLSLRSRLRRHPVLLTTAVAAAVHLLWFFFFANSGGDIASGQYDLGSVTASSCCRLSSRRS